MNNRLTLDISWQSFARFFIILVSLLAIVYFQKIIFAFLTAIILATILEAPIRWFNNHKVSRILSAIFVYLLLIVIVAGIIYLIIPSILSSISNLYNLLPDWFNLDKLEQGLRKYGFTGFKLSEDWLNNFLSHWAEIGANLANAFKIGARFFGGLFVSFLIFIIAFYINIDRKGIEKFIRFATPRAYEDYALSLWRRWQKKIGSWFYSQLVISLLMGLVIFLGLTFLKVKYALLLGLLMALLEFIPYLGPILAVTIAMILGAEQGLMTIFLIFILYLAVQELEHIISPSIRSKIIQIDPILIILGVLIGAKLFGFLGIMLAIPVLTLLVEIIRDYKYERIVPFLKQRPLEYDQSEE